MFALACATVQIYVLPNRETKHASFDFVQVASIDTSSSAVGIADSSLYFMTPDEVNTALDAMLSMGVTQLRVFVPWKDVEASKGQYNWDAVDTVVNAAYERGIAVAAVVTTSPTWATDYSVSPYGEPRDVQDYANFMSALASRYGAGDADPEEAKISAYEIWNEPQNFLAWFPTPSAKEYTELLKAAYTAIKAVDPSGTVIGGVVTAGLTWMGMNINPVDFVKSMYETGAAGYFDVLSYHPYNYNLLFSQGQDVANSAYKQLLAIQALMAKYGDGDKQVWASEFGIPTTVVSEAKQKQFIMDFLQTWSQLSGVGPAFIYSLLDLDSSSDGRQNNFGLFHDDWTPKEVAAAIAAWIAGTYVDDFPPAEQGANPNFLSQVISVVTLLSESVASLFGQTFGSVLGSVQDLLTSVVKAVGKLVTQVLSALSPTKSSTVQAAAVASTELSSDAAHTEASADAATATAPSGGDSAVTEATAAAEAPAVETPVAETPVAETPVAETPVAETPVVETPVAETPVVETPETPVVEEPAGDTTTEESTTEDSNTEDSATSDATTEDPTTEDSTEDDASKDEASKDEAKAAAKDDADAESASCDEGTRSGGLPAARPVAGDDDSSASGVRGTTTDGSGRDHAHSGSASDGGSDSDSDSQ
ncbi:MAG: cellulase family glycosylhydrolase [Mycobacterium sp.]|nr:cellulase family glycosylhydrolase [Mycobacterium sp.]